MRGLKICLWIAGGGCLLSVFGVFLPVSAWESMAKLFGVESLSDSPVFEYAARAMSAMCVAAGVFLIILACRPMDYGVMVPFAGISAILLGLVCAITGMVVSMPVLWFLGDSIPCVVLGILIVFFWRQAKINN